MVDICAILPQCTVIDRQLATLSPGIQSFVELLLILSYTQYVRLSCHLLKFSKSEKLRMRLSLFILGMMFLSSATSFAQQKDSKDCVDHPLFTRMPDVWIHGCDHKEFDAYNFAVGPKKVEHVEGEIWKIHYYPQASSKTHSSELQIHRNFENAVKDLGGTVVGSDGSKETFRLTKAGKDIWVEVWSEFTGKYGLTIAERKSMSQDIKINAEMLLSSLKSTGHVEVQGIYFDTGKSELKPESQQSIAEIAKLLKSDPGLKLFVVGHTDNVGTVESNLKLSQDRAEAVVQALVRGEGIPAIRLRSFGCGPFAPNSSNDVETGRALNRRVELVKQ
jgi:outer membrane protein OmpA-like peptidoglycan-associated protein